MAPWETGTRAGVGLPDTGMVAPRGSMVSHAILTLPNIISFARLCVVPLAVWLVLHRRFGAAFALFVAAGISDGIDGWLARRRGGSALGAILDPLADKALMVSMFVTLAATAELPDWLAILVVFRDLVIVGGVVLLWFASHPVAIRPLFVSKLNTAMQIGLVAEVLGSDAAGLPWAALRGALVFAVVGTTLASGAGYVWRVARPV